MLKELVEYLFRLGQSEKTAKVIPVPGAPPHVVLIQKPDGECEWEEIQPEARAHGASDLSCVIQFAEENPKTARVWYSGNGVRCILDDATRRDYVFIELAESTQVARLREFAKTTFGQRDLILELRTTFIDCMGPCVGLLNALRVLKFISNVSGESTTSQGKASIGKRIEQEVTGADALPEMIEMDVPIYDGGFLSIERIRLALDIDTQNQRFKLVPITGDIDRAFVRSEEKIRKHLTENLPEGVKVCYGTP